MICRDGSSSSMHVVALDPEPFHQLRYIVDSAFVAKLPFIRAKVDSLPEGVEAIVATGDLQGVVSRDGSRPEILLGEALAAELGMLRDRGELPAKEKTAILLTGDLQPSADVGDVSGVWQRLGEAGRWVAGVAGNHDAFGPDMQDAHGQSFPDLPNLHLFDERLDQIDGLLIGGLSGIVGSSAAPGVRLEPDFAAAMARLAALRPAVLLSHDGPTVAGTQLSGWPGVRRALEDAPATLLFRGHDPWPISLATLSNGTQVVNVEGRVMILTRDLGV